MSDSSNRFAHGVASGDPYADSVILWTRISPQDSLPVSVDVSWQISAHADFAPSSIVASGVFTTSAARDWTVKVDAKGLKADTPYYYRFLIGDSVSPVGQTKTLPIGSDPVRLAVFSCANFPAADQFDAYGRAAAINAANPYDAWVHLGDYIYEYGPGGYSEAEAAAGTRAFLPNREIISLADYRERYAQYHSDASLQTLRAAAPLIAIWDDHETANDSWTGGAQNHQPATDGDWTARRDAALKAYYEWMPVREPGLRQASDGATASSPLSQGYRSFNFGDVLALHVLETRLTARDQQLSYPDAAAVQARIVAILADSAQTVAYANRLGLNPPANAAAVSTFAQALAPAVTQELVTATMKKAWGDPDRDLIGDTQMAWLQQQMASSPAAWQVLGQQVLMQSMAVPAELLLNAGNPALLDKYAAPLQKLATGTPFASLSSAEQALFAEAGKIPYNLDAWDGYGVERETILQTALTLGKRLISLAGDTHNAWAGVLDTMSAGTKPAGTLAGLEFATPGVTSPGFEKYLPGADAYIRARYPAVDGLDGLFMGYINGLKYADVNRRGFLDLTVTPEQASGSFQLLDGRDPVSGAPIWTSETVASDRSFSLAVGSEASPLISWQPAWRELDLVFGMAVDEQGRQTLLDPGLFASVARDGVQLADVTVQGSDRADRIVAGVGSRIDGGGGADEIFSTDSQGANLLIGGLDGDTFYLRSAGDRVIGGILLAGSESFNLPYVTALADGAADRFLIDSSDPLTGSSPLQIRDFERSRDSLLLDGQSLSGPWDQIKSSLATVGVSINATPDLSAALRSLSLQLIPGQTASLLLPSTAGLDADGDSLRYLVLEGPTWASLVNGELRLAVPAGLSKPDFDQLRLRLGLSDGAAVQPFDVTLSFQPNLAPKGVRLLNAVGSLSDDTSTNSRVRLADLEIQDDRYGTNKLLLAGPDAADFEIVDDSLYLKANTRLNVLSKSRYLVRVLVDDTSLPDPFEASTEFSLAITAALPRQRGRVVVPTTDSEGRSREIPVILAGADLTPNTNLQVVTNLGLSSSSLTALADLNVKPSASGLDFSLKVDSGQTSARLSSLLDLVASDLKSGLSDASGKPMASQRLLYYSLDSSGGIAPLTYDPIAAAGARFYDLSGDGIADFLTLVLKDGGFGDKDGAVNGTIQDPSFAALATLNPGFISSAGRTLQVLDPSTPALPAPVRLRVALGSRAETANSLYYVVLNAAELSNPAAILSDLNQLRSRARLLLSSLESSDVTLPSGVAMQRDLLLLNGQAVRLFEVADGTLAEIKTINDSRLRFLDPASTSPSQATYSSTTGVSLSLSIQPGDPGLNALVGQEQSQSPVLDFTAFAATQTVRGTVSMGREASFDGITGFYRTLDLNGTVLAADGITRLQPSDAAYATQALRSANQVASISDLSVSNRQTLTRSFDLQESTYLAPFAKVEGNTFFAFAAANSDGISHFRSLGTNLFGLEDLRGGGDLDFDDLVVGFNFTQVL